MLEYRSYGLASNARICISSGIFDYPIRHDHFVQIKELPRRIDVCDGQSMRVVRETARVILKATDVFENSSSVLVTRNGRTSIFCGRNADASPLNAVETPPSKPTVNVPWFPDVAPYTVIALPRKDIVAVAPGWFVRLQICEL